MKRPPLIQSDMSALSADELWAVVDDLQQRDLRREAQMAELRQLVQMLRDEIAALKRHSPRPVFKGSNMDKHTNRRDDDPPPGTAPGGTPMVLRAGSAKRSKTAALAIHHGCLILPAQPLPVGSVLVEYRDYVVQDLLITANNTRYRRAVYRTPGGELLVGELPYGVAGSHFGAELRTYVLHQHHHCHVTQPKLVEQLQEWGLSISAGQLNALLTQGSEVFTAEKTAILTTGLKVSPAVTVDDSGARHDGANGYVLGVSTPLWAWFESTKSKSKTNFLELLHGGAVQYLINEAALTHMARFGLPVALVIKLRKGLRDRAAPVWTLEQLQQYLLLSGIAGHEHRRIVTEGALWGALQHKVHPHLAVVSDGALQFVIGEHGLCWVHSERLVHKLIPRNDAQRAEQARVRSEIWELFAALKDYKLHPTAARAGELDARFDAVFGQKTDFPQLTEQLARLYARKDELLLVLKRPDVSLHTNMSETDLRDRVKKRKVSGGTRSDLGRTCRDTFSSLLKTCRKLDVSFWRFLQERLNPCHVGPVMPLPELIRARSALGAPG